MIKRVFILSMFVFALFLLMNTMVVSAETEAIPERKLYQAQQVFALPPQQPYEACCSDGIVGSVALDFDADQLMLSIRVHKPEIMPESDANGMPITDSRYYRTFYTAFRLSESAG